jgi:hypothetical protein
MTMAHVNRLRRAAQLLAGRGFDTGATRFTCYSAAGFDERLRAAVTSDDRIQLVGLADLYAPGLGTGR